MEGEVKALVKNADAKTVNSLNWTIYLKKHKNKTVAQILEDDPGYIIFIEEKVAWLRVAPDILKLAQEKLELQANGGAFVIDPKELEANSNVLQSIALGLDTYGKDGVRQLHGISNDVNVHKALTYYQKLTKHLLQTSKA